jgi:ribosomal protein S27E
MDGIKALGHSRSARLRLRDLFLSAGFSHSIAQAVVKAQVGSMLEFYGPASVEPKISAALEDCEFDSYIVWLKKVQADVAIFQSMKFTTISCPDCNTEAVRIPIPTIRFHIRLPEPSSLYVRCTDCGAPLIIRLDSLGNPKCTANQRG